MIKYPAQYIKEENFYSIRFIDIDAVTQGKTMEELLLNAKDILSLVIEEDLKRSKEIPDPSVIKGENILYVEPYSHVVLSLLVRQLRKEENLTQKQVADRINMAYQSYQKIEHCQRSNITLKTLQKLAQAFGKNIEIRFV